MVPVMTKDSRKSIALSCQQGSTVPGTQWSNLMDAELLKEVRLFVLSFYQLIDQSFPVLQLREGNFHW